jgi:tyrosyl-tRNA synthetase
LHKKIKLLHQNEITEIYGLTCPLLLTKDGKKMGKTENGTLWVARDKTTVFDFYQYFYNVDDESIEMLLKLFTRMSLEEIEDIINDDVVKAKRRMAYEVTKLVHGEEEAKKVLNVVSNLFGQKNGDNAPESDYVITDDTINVIDLFVNSGMVASKSEARRLIQQKGLYVDDNQCKDVAMIVTKPNDKGYVLLKKGKKKYLKVRFN